MANQQRQISLGDLLKSIVHEFSDALNMVKRSHPMVAVRSVKLNIGQDPQIEAGPDAGSPVPLILPDRYPEIDKGWLLELELGERPVASLRGAPLPELDVTVPTALDFFAEHPLTIIKGIDTGWAERFAGFEILRVRHLALLEEPLLQKIVAKSHSLRPREFRQKTLLLNRPLPALPKTAADDSSIYELLRLPLAELQELLGAKRVSGPELTGLRELLDILNLVIDSSLLRRVDFVQLLDS